MTDPYPIGINTTGCNDTYGDCGCDDCVGSVVDVGTRIERVLSLIDESEPVWAVPQLFGNSSYWSRLPTAEEEYYMTYTAIIHGATGVLPFIYPSWQNFSDPLPVMVAKLASEIKQLTPWLTGGNIYTITPAMNNWPVSIAGFNGPDSILLIISNNEPSSQITNIDLHSNINGNAVGLFNNSILSHTVKNGLFTDTLPPLTIHLYEIKL